MVGQEQEGLCPVPALDRADDARSFDSADRVRRPLESDSLREDRHYEPLARKDMESECKELEGVVTVVL